MASIASQNCLRELHLFLKNVLNAFDLHSTFSGLMHYSFGPRRLIEVVNTALKDESQRAEVEFVINSLAEFVISEINYMLKKSPILEIAELKHRISLAWEVYDVLKKHFADSNEEAQMESLFNDFNGYLTSGTLAETCLPSEVRKFFGKNSDFKPKPVPLSRDADFYTVPASSPVVEPLCKFTESFNEAVNKLKTSSDDSQSWINLVNYKFDKNNLLSQKNAIQLIGVFFAEWDTISTPSLLPKTLTILEKICCSTSLTSRRSVFEEAQHQSLTKGIPDFANSIPDFQRRLTKCINALKSHNAIQHDRPGFEQLRAEMQFLVLLAPRITLQALLTHCFQNKDYIPAAIYTLRGLQTICNALVPHSHKKYPLLIAVLDIVLSNSLESLTSPEFVDTVVYIIVSLCRRKRATIKEKGEEGRVLRNILGEVIEDSVLNPSDIIFYFICPKLFNKQSSNAELRTMLILLKRIFASTGSKDTELSYSVLIEESPTPGTVPVTQLFELVHTFLVNSENSGNDISSLCFNVFKSLGCKLKEDDVILPLETVNFILDKLTTDAWWFKYAISSWYSHSMSHPPLEIPSGLFYALPEEFREHYKEIKVDFHTSPVTCLLCSLFELGLFDPELAIDLLNRGLDLLPMDNLLIDQIALALSDCCVRPFFTQRFTLILPVLERMLEIFDPRMPLSYVLDQVNDNILRALRVLKSVQLLGKAAKITFIKVYQHDAKYVSYYPSASLDCPRPPSEAAENLLQSFTELAKTQADKQMQLFRHLVRKRDLGDHESKRESEKLEEQLITQLVILFHEGVMFTRFEIQNNASLHILLTTLSDYIKEVRSNHKNDSLDKKKISYKQAEYIYANVPCTSDTASEPEDDPVPNSYRPKNDKIPYKEYSDPQYSHPCRRNHTGFRRKRDDRSTWDGTNNNDRYSETSLRAVARQIPHDKTREQVQRRLDDFNAPSLPKTTENRNHQWKGNRRPYQSNSRPLRL